MSETSLKYISQVANYLKIPIKNLQFNESQLPSCSIDNNIINGFINIIYQLVLKAKGAHLLGTTELENAQIRQWLEYIIVYVIKIDSNQQLKQILGELDAYLSSRTFFVSQKMTIADILLYYTLTKHMVKLGYIDKKSLVHLCRWFNNMQCNEQVRQNNKVIKFCTIDVTKLTL